MEKLSKQLEYFITSLALVGMGLLLYFMNGSVNTYTVLHFSLFQMMQGILLLICGLLLAYQAYMARKGAGSGESGEASAPPEQAGARQERQDAVDSVNATMILVVVAVLVVGYYMFTMRTSAEVAGAVAPLHMVIGVVAFILYACIERWWAMQLAAGDGQAASVCNLMVLNKIGVAALMADMITSFTGLFSVSLYADYMMWGLWFYVAAMAAVSVAVKVLRHGGEMSFRLYILLPAYYSGGKEGSGALNWLERNTGISMRSLWSLKFVKMTLPACGFAVVVLLWLSTCLVQVEANQQGALYRFGSLSREDILQPGLHFKLPVPFEEARLYNVMQPQSMIVGYEGDVNNKNNLWTRPHEGEEQALLLGNGNELVAINLKITYRISDLYTYLTAYADPASVLNAKGYEIVMDMTVGTDIDTIISEDRSVLSHRIEAQLKQYARQAGLGLEVMSVNLASIHPPVAIADVYQSVVSAGIQKKTAILTAEGQALVAREGAAAQREIAINDAGIRRDERISAANAEVEEYNAGIEAYLLDPESYRLVKYLDTFETVMAGRKKYLVDPDVDVGSLYGNFGIAGTRWFEDVMEGAQAAGTGAEDAAAAAGEVN